MLRELAETLITLPVPLIALLVLGLLAWRRRRLSFALIALSALGLVGFSLPITTDLLEAPLESAAPAFDAAAADRQAQAEVILVPTAGIFADSEGSWWASSQSVMRAVAGRKLQDSSGLPLVLIGGSPEDEAESEAVTVARQVGLIGRADGARRPPVFMETAARNSAETARAAKLILGRLGARRVVLVTEPAHVARMAASLRHNGLEVLALAARAAAPPRRPLGALTGFVPSAGGLNRSAKAVREYVAILWYLAQGHVRLSDLRPAPALQPGADG